jgi:hypothetical protein
MPPDQPTCWSGSNFAAFFLPGSRIAVGNGTSLVYDKVAYFPCLSSESSANALTLAQFAGPEQLASRLQAWHADHPNQQLLALLAEADREQLPNLQTACLHQGIELAGGVFPRLISDQGLLTMGHAAPCPAAAKARCYASIPGKTGTNRATHERAHNANACCMAGRTGQTYLVHDFRWHAARYRFHSGCLVPATGRSGVLRRVNAGSAQFQPIPCLFDQYQSMMHGVLCLLLPATANPVINHGYRP